MSTWKKLFWIISLLFVVGGCSSYRSVAVPATATEADAGADSRIRTGDRVRIVLVDGRQVDGDVVGVASESIHLDSGYLQEVVTEWPAADTAARTVVPFAQVRHVEVKRTNVLLTVLSAGVAAGALAYILTPRIDIDFKTSGSAMPSGSARWPGR